MKKCNIFLILYSCATVAQGGVIASAPSSGWADSAWTGGEEYRWGATARNMDTANGDWELGIGSDHAMSEDTTHLDWSGPGTMHSFLLDYDSSTDQATWTVNGQETELLDPTLPFSDMYIQLKGRPSSSDAYISISNTTLTVEGFVSSIDAFAAGYGETAELQYVHINNSDGPLSDMDFILEGTLYIDWTGAVPSRDEMGMHVKMTQIPEPTSIVMVIMVSALGLLIRRKFGS